MKGDRTDGVRDAGPACPVCALPRAAAFAIGRDRLFDLAPGRFRLFRCPACGCVFQHPLPEPSAIAAFYPDQYWWKESRHTRASLILSRLERRYREFVALDHVRFLQRCASRAAGGRSLLDIGCGSGTFLHLARKRGFDPHGLDMSANAVAAAQAEYGLRARQGDIGGDAWRGFAFDFITMFHVLEHVPDPLAALAYAGGLLAPGGSLIVQVPNAASLQARVFGARWYGLDVPRHLINFTPRALALLFERAGFDAEVVNRFSLRDNPAALASSLAPALDPIGRRGRRKGGHPATEGALEFCYLGMILLALPPAWIESLCGRGATIWAHARRPQRSEPDPIR
jgi:2-polyprenyl-3-methyl-5-hydroxy-6-metoxy-1,4-benzoquinol methylase